MDKEIGWGKIFGCITDIICFIISGIQILLGNAEPIVYLEFWGSIVIAVMFVLYHILKKD